MAKKKKTEQATTPEPPPAEEMSVEVQPPAPAKIMAQTMWRRWGAPAWVVETGAPVSVPAQTLFEVLELRRDEIVAVHPGTGACVLMRRVMITLV